MESIVHLMEAPLQLEPVDQLAPYLNNLGNFNEALEALADLVLVEPAEFSPRSSSSCYSPSSPGGASETSSINCCANCCLAAAGSSGSSSTGSSSTCGYSSSTSLVAGGRSRRRKNATAAERYRKKLKGRRSSLSDDLEREQLRNAKLRRSLDAKLVLYREFASLLAQNTQDRDLELAQLGAQSIGSILINNNHDDEDSQLRHLQSHFERVLRNQNNPIAFQ